MLLVKNMAAYMVNIPPRTHIAPTATAEVDEKNRGVALLIKRGVLVDASSPAASALPDHDAALAIDEDDDGAPEPGEPTKVADIKAELDHRGITYADTAKKAELLELLRASNG
ncbi:MAG TPA: HeH/LEM domain-containing protein [Pseudolabrys sp.]|jgi:hypothetical protein|nr:HeH/LEM domain-containing protein [Pseudolabrys sp.]